MTVPVQDLTHNYIVATHKEVDITNIYIVLDALDENDAYDELEADLTTIVTGGVDQPDVTNYSIKTAITTATVSYLLSKGISVHAEIVNYRQLADLMTFITDVYAWNDATTIPAIELLSSSEYSELEMFARLTALYINEPFETIYDYLVAVDTSLITDILRELTALEAIYELSDDDLIGVFTRFHKFDKELLNTRTYREAVTYDNLEPTYNEASRVFMTIASGVFSTKELGDEVLAGILLLTSQEAHMTEMYITTIESDLEEIMELDYTGTQITNITKYVLNGILRGNTDD